MSVLPFREAHEWAAAVPRVAAHVAQGGLLAYPTETIYGLGSRPLADDVARLAALKGRAPGKPFLLLVATRQMAERANLHFTPSAAAMADAFWPGPLTLILAGGGTLPDSLRGPEGGFAVRWTSHPGIASLIAHLGGPLTSTSANRAGGPTAPGVDAIRTTFREAVERRTLLVLDGGVLGNVPPSTVIDCTTALPRLVREGAVPRAELRARVGRFAP